MSYEVSSITLCYGLSQKVPAPQNDQVVVEKLLEKCVYKHTGEARELCLLHVQVIVHETPRRTLRSLKKPDAVQYDR